MSEGFTEGEVLDMPLNKTFLYMEGARRKHSRHRQEEFADLCSAIAIAFSGKGFKAHMDAIGDENG